MKSVYREVTSGNEACKRQQHSYDKGIRNLMTTNRELKGKLMDAEK